MLSVSVNVPQTLDISVHIFLVAYKVGDNHSFILSLDDIMTPQ